MLLADALYEPLDVPARRQVRLGDELVLAQIELLAQDIRGICGAHIRRGQDQVELDAQVLQPAGDLTELLAALVGQGPLAVLFLAGCFLACFGDCVTHDVQVHGFAPMVTVGPARRARTC